MDPSQNRLLALLPAQELDALRPHLQQVTLSYAQPLITPNKPIRHVYFPVTGLGSLVAMLEDGSSVEAGIVGREGMTGIPVILGADTTPMQTLVQIPGEGFRMETQVIKAEMERRGALHSIMHRYTHTLFVIASQSVACGRRHSIEARLCRWLLMSSDGIGSNDLAITQEFLATMLGVRRAGVTEAAMKLQEQGWIRYSRGFVRLLDRAALEGATCECYHIVRREYERLFGPL
jgi:CRP-like cAMP-binding protein